MYGGRGEPSRTEADRRESVEVMWCEVGLMLSMRTVRSLSHFRRTAGSVLGYRMLESFDQAWVA